MTAKKKKEVQLEISGPMNEVTAPDFCKSATPIQKSNILSLDVATNCGFCTSSASGVWNLTPKKDESKGMRLIRFRSKITEMVRVHGIKLVVFEGAVGYGKHPNFVGAEMIGVLKLTLEELGVEYASYMPTSIKKFATGSGNAGKPAMIKAAQDRWGMKGKDDNEADAIAIFHFAVEDLGIEKPKPLF